MNFGRPRRAPLALDITPLIDIIFQLVLFFMVSTTFIAAPGIQVDLPRSSSEVVLQQQDDLNIWMTAAGAVLVNEEPVDEAGLRARLDAAARRDPSTLVIVKADQAVSHGRVVTVMDMARSRGLSRLAIATDPGQGAGEEE